MFDSDPRYATLPRTTGVAQLRWFIEQVATDQLTVAALIEHFRHLYEAIELQGRPRYSSKEEARLIWDVLWALEFYSADPAQEEAPSEWNSSDMVKSEVKRVAARLKEL